MPTNSKERTRTFFVTDCFVAADGKHKGNNFSRASASDISDFLETKCEPSIDCVDLHHPHQISSFISDEQKSSAITNLPLSQKQEKFNSYNFNTYDVINFAVQDTTSRRPSASLIEQVFNEGDLNESPLKVTAGGLRASGYTHPMHVSTSSCTNLCSPISSDQLTAIQCSNDGHPRILTVLQPSSQQSRMTMDMMTKTGEVLSYVQPSSYGPSRPTSAGSEVIVIEKTQQQKLQQQQQQQQLQKQQQQQHRVNGKVKQAVNEGQGERKKMRKMTKTVDEKKQHPAALEQRINNHHVNAISSLVLKTEPTAVKLTCPVDVRLNQDFASLIPSTFPFTNQPYISANQQMVVKNDLSLSCVQLCKQPPSYNDAMAKPLVVDGLELPPTGKTFSSTLNLSTIPNEYFSSASSSVTPSLSALRSSLPAGNCSISAASATPVNFNQPPLNFNSFDNHFSNPVTLANDNIQSAYRSILPVSLQSSNRLSIPAPPSSNSSTPDINTLINSNVGTKENANNLDRKSTVGILNAFNNFQKVNLPEIRTKADDNTIMTPMTIIPPFLPLDSDYSPIIPQSVATVTTDLLPSPVSGHLQLLTNVKKEETKPASISPALNKINGNISSSSISSNSSNNCSSNSSSNSSNNTNNGSNNSNRNSPVDNHDSRSICTTIRYRRPANSDLEERRTHYCNYPSKLIYPIVLLSQ